MPQENKAVIGCRGDFGNPSGSGLSKITLSDIWPGENVDLTAKSPDMVAFHAALVTAQLTATTVGSRSVTATMPANPAKPGADVNIDREIVCTWRLATSNKTRQLTVPGVPLTSTSIEKIDNGERLSDTGKAALATALEGAFGLSAGDVVVLYGKVLQKS
jgi:hypothetical protein